MVRGHGARAQERDGCERNTGGRRRVCLGLHMSPIIRLISDDQGTFTVGTKCFHPRMD